MPSEDLSPLPPDAWPAALGDLAKGFAGGLNVYRLMAHNPALLRAWAPLREHVVGAEALGAERQEVVVLRIAHRLPSAYEWAHHVRRAGAIGFSAERIESLRCKPENMTEGDALLTLATDEILDTGRLSAALKGTLLSAVGAAATLDLMATVGFYLTLGAIVNSFEAPLDDLPGST